MTGSAWKKGGFWTIGPNPKKRNSGNVASVERPCVQPDEIREWKYYYDGTWYTDPLLTVTGNIINEYISVLI